MAHKIPGPFVPLSTDFPDDRAVVNSGYAAELLFIRGMIYARKNPAQEGLIPDFNLASVARGIPNPKKHAAALVREKLWIAERGGWRIRSWEKWNGSAEELKAQQSAGGKLGNHNKWHQNGRFSADCPFCPPSVDRSLTDRSTDSVPTRSGSLEVEREGERER